MLFWSLVSTLLVSLLFVVFPSLDIYYSSLFWDAEKGFFLSDQPLVVLSAVYNYLLVIVYLCAMAIMVIVYWFWRRGTDFRQVLFLLVSLFLGPGLAVNSILKSFWGRSRPLTTDIFGGTQTFSPAWYISEQCDTNCAFVSGHASAAFAFYAFALLAFHRFRLWLPIFILVTLFGFIVGMGRVIEGKHFISDILIAGHIVWLVSLVCYYPVWRHRCTVDRSMNNVRHN